MASQKPVIHGRDHLPGGADPIPFVAAATTGIYATSPQILPILIDNRGAGNVSVGYGFVTVDTSVRFNAVATNQNAFHTAALNDYMTHLVTLGPKGSVWGVAISHKAQSNGGKYKISLASVASPNPFRTGDNTGSLVDSFAPTYVVFPLEGDTYNATPLDTEYNGYIAAFRMLGDDGDPLTTRIAGGDTYTGYNTIDGGAGMYRLRLQVTGKNASSSGFRCDITGITLLRLDDVGYQ